MRKLLLPTLIFTLLFAAFSGVSAQVIPAIPPTDIMPLSQIKEGMKGTARTVFRGTKPEEFSVEILGVVPGSVGPRQDLIIGILSGANAMRTQVFAGMSGSPVYIDGKLVGAISYSFPYAKEPICGITPIEQMISIFDGPVENRAGSSKPFVLTAASLMAENWSSELPFGVKATPVISGMAMNSRLSQVAGQTLVPISTPVTFTGVSQQVLDKFSSAFAGAGIIPMATSGAGSAIVPLSPITPTTLLGGDSVVVQLSRGDVSISAAGTVTMRSGDKIYAFGHPYFSLGSTNLPMNESHVITVVPSLNNSFKMAVPDALVGAMTQDRATGIYGKLGVEPKMLPIEMRITSSRGRNETVKFDSAIDEFLTPLIINLGGQNTISAQERTIGDTTVDVNATIKIRGEQSVRIERRSVGGQALALGSASVALPVAALLKANFPGLELESVDVDFKVSEGAKAAAVERITVDRAQVRAGEAVDVTVYSRTDSGSIVTQVIGLTIPKDTPAGPLSLVVGDGATVQEKAAIQQFVPKNAAELISILNNAKRTDRLYAVLTRTSGGIVSGASEMPNMPPSMLATINNDRSAGGPKAVTTKTILEQMIAPSDYVTTGTQTLAIEVIR